jgi:DNA-directed RNA polymerase subunit beta'
MPNPIFEKPILSLTGLKRREFNAVMAAETRIDGKTSGMAIKKELDKIDVDKELKSTEEALPRLKGPALDRANKKVKYLRALKKVGMKPSEAYMNRNVPVLPPSMRPVSALDNGELNYDDTNGLYKQIALIDQKMRGMDKALPDEEKDNLRKEMYDGLKALQMNGGVIRGKEHRGVMGMIAGDQPKRGFFQDKITARQQDMSLRSTIIPEPSLSLDEVGLPRKAAMGTYKPFVVQYMHRNMGFTPLDAQKAIKANHPAANRALEKVVAERPILLKRDPALHKHNVMAFKPKLVSGKAIRIHPLVTGGFNADFDGDTMVGFVPVSTKAVDESYKMLPSKNLFSETHGRAMHVPGQDSLLGLYDMTAMGKRTRATFADEKAVLEARKAGRIGTTDVVRMAGKPTTAGRVQVAQTLPGKLATRTQVLHDPKFQLKKKNLAAVITDAARNTPNDFSGVADGLKDTGDAYAYQTAPSIGLDDISPHIETKNRALADAEKRIALYKGKDKERYSLNEYARAMDQIEKKVKPQIAKDNTALYTMMDSGARGNWDQIRQMVAAPVLVKDPQNKVVPFPIKTGFSEGMQIADYWTQMHGVRKGEVGKVISTQRPGSMTKNLVNANMNQLAVDKDCGTSRGVMMKVDDREVLDRHLAAPVSLRKGEVLPRNTVVTPGVVTRLKNSKKSKIPVRSPLKCEHGDGICPQCYGLMADGRLPEPGTNLGVISSQAMGEPATQLALNTFHTGGVATPSEARGTTSSDKFARVEQLLAMPKTLPGSATLATANGPVDRVRKDPAGGFEVIVGGQRHYVPKDRGLLPGVRRGKKVKKGTRLSHGPVNPRELLDLTNVDTVRNYLTDELYDAYKDNGPVRRKNFEVVVRGMTNLTQVRDPGDNPNYLRGDVVPATRVAAENRASKGRPVRHAPLLKGIADVPRDSFEDWVARMQHTKLKSTLIDAASQGWSSDVHGMHPIPAVAYGAEFGKPKGKVPANLEFVY